MPPIPGIDGPNTLDAQEILYDRVEVAKGERVVVVGGSATGCETAEWLAAAGAVVTIVEMLPVVGTGIELITRTHLLRELRAAGVTILRKTRVTSIEPDAVLTQSTEDGSTARIEADRVALAVGWHPRGQAIASLVSGPEVVLVGDALRPGDFVSAINQGADAGLAV